MNDTISNVAITGGTHGNELAGVYLIKHWLPHAEEVKRGSFSSELQVADHEAVKDVRRYIDRDLNRQFNLQDLHNPELKCCPYRCSLFVEHYSSCVFIGKSQWLFAN